MMLLHAVYFSHLLPTDHKYTGAVTVAKRFSQIHVAIIYDLLWNAIAKLARCLLGLILMK